LLYEKDNDNTIADMLLGKNSEQYLPPNLPVEEVDSLPKKPGVYYFYNAAGKVIYVGKAKNIFRRVKTHFSNNKTGKQKQDFLKEIFRVTYQVTATELMAHILESAEIRALWPRYNHSQRGFLPRFGLFVYEDQQGFHHLAIEKNKQALQPLYSFNTIYEGQQRLRQLIREHHLCPRLCHLAKTTDCTEAIENGYCEGNCRLPAKQYNRKVSKAVSWLETHLPSFAFIDKGRNPNEQSCILIEKGNFYGMGYISDQRQLKSMEKIKNFIEPMHDNDFIRNLIYRQAANHPEQCIYFK
jgi:DNA polymerase-3 subunit epsilon